MLSNKKTTGLLYFTDSYNEEKSMKHVFNVGFWLLAGLFSLNVQAATPQDGIYGGVTSQGSEFTLEVTNGNVSKIRFLLKPACMGLSWGLGYVMSMNTNPEGNFSFHQYIRFDEAGAMTGFTPGQNFPAYGFGFFDTPTHATGEIWHAVAYFNGTGGDISSCFDLSNRFEVNYVGDRKSVV